MYKTTTNEYIPERTLDYIKSIVDVERRRDEEQRALGMQYRIQINTPLARISEYAYTFEMAQQIAVYNICDLGYHRDLSTIYSLQSALQLASDEPYCLDDIFYTKTRCFREGVNPFEIAIIDLYPKSGKIKQKPEIIIEMDGEDNASENN